MARLSLVSAALLCLACALTPALACVLCQAGHQCCTETSCASISGINMKCDGTVVTGPGGINYENYCQSGTTGLKNNDLLKDGVTYKYEVIAQVAATSYSQCCAACAQQDGCSQFRWFPTNTLGGECAVYPKPYPTCAGACGPYDVNGKSCVLIKFNGNSFCYRNGTIGCTLNGPALCWPCPGLATGPLTCNGAVKSYLGGNCSPAQGVTDDPHFTDGNGVRFDFNGELDRSFCLITDKDFNINMVLSGYYDTRQYGASVQADGKTIRSWITGLGLMWTDAAGVSHSVLLTARSGTEQSRKEGFLKAIVADGKNVAVPNKEGEALEVGGMTLKFKAVTYHGPYDLDKYSLVIGDKVDIDLSLRVAHKLLQTPKEAYAHFNIRINSLNASPAVHGVLGQTFRSEAARTVKALEYRLLSTLLHKPLQADGVSGMGYLDGKVQDYETSGPLLADCAFAKVI